MISQVVNVRFICGENRDARGEVFIDSWDLQQGRHLGNVPVEHQGLLALLLGLEAQRVGVQAVHEGGLFDRMQCDGTVDFLVFEVPTEGPGSAAIVV